MSRSSLLVGRLLTLLVGFVIVVAGVVAASTCIDDLTDRAILLALNPDHYVPVLDEAMVLVTDFSEQALGVVLVSWLIGYYVCRNRPERKRMVAHALRLMGVVFGVCAASGIVWRGYTYEVVLVPYGLALTAGLWIAGTSFVRADDATLRRFAVVVWLVALSSFLTSFLAEGFVKSTVQRARPLADVNVGWNHAIRLVPDEVVRTGYSYASGHSAGLFALVTPMFWATRRTSVRVALLLWATVHSFTRVYLAAHYPFCALMGSVMGCSIGSLVFFTFGRALVPGSPGAELSRSSDVDPQGAQRDD